MSDELKPCPFCGGPAGPATKRATAFPSRRWKVACADSSCGAHYGYWHPNEWNHRGINPTQVAPQPEQGAPQKYDDVLLPFLAMMRAELHANSDKGDRPGWLAMDVKTALLEIFYHMGKLQKAAKKGDHNGIREYSADVANMSMMLADICGTLPEYQAQTAPQPVAWRDETGTLYPSRESVAKYLPEGRIATPLYAAPIAQTAPLFGDEGHVSVPRGLIGAACSAIDKKRDSPKVLAELRRYTFGDLSKQTAPQPEQSGLRAIHAMILNALDRDAAEGKVVRGEMAAELRAALSTTGDRP